MVRIPVKVVLDTNILVSALIFGGKPRLVELLVLEKRIAGVSSSSLLAELLEVLSKKFHFNQSRIVQTQDKIRKNFLLVQPSMVLDVVHDDDDNRVLEAAVEGECKYIITGDKELLNLGQFRGIKIMKAGDFLECITFA